MPSAAPLGNVFSKLRGIRFGPALAYATMWNPFHPWDGAYRALLLCKQGFGNRGGTGRSARRGKNLGGPRLQINEAAGLTGLRGDEKTTVVVHSLPRGQRVLLELETDMRCWGLKPPRKKEGGWRGGGLRVTITQQPS